MACGYLWRIAWNNPYTEPADGKRILAEMYVLSDGHTGASKPAEIAAFPVPPGYSICITHIKPPMISKQPGALAKIRQQRLAARYKAKAPLFADTFIAEDIAAKPDYYIDGTSSHDAVREEILAAEQATYEFMLNNHGRLFIR